MARSSSGTFSPGAPCAPRSPTTRARATGSPDPGHQRQRPLRRVRLVGEQSWPGTQQPADTFVRDLATAIRPEYRCPATALQGREGGSSAPSLSGADVLSRSIRSRRTWCGAIPTGGGCLRARPLVPAHDARVRRLRRRSGRRPVGDLFRAGSDRAGRLVAFESEATNLVPGTPTPGRTSSSTTGRQARTSGCRSRAEASGRWRVPLALDQRGRQGLRGVRLREQPGPR